MAAPANVDELIKLIRKSGMLEEPRLDAYLDKLKATGTFVNDVKKMAGAMVKDGMLTYFQAEQFVQGKWRGFTVGKYKLLERIGFGGMGQVFLCEHLYMKRRVAIKVLPPAKAEEPAALGRFYREARAAAALDDPNIVRTHDIDQDGNLHFLVMEYVDGSSLLDIIKKTGPMEVKRAVNYVWQSLLALDHAFKVGVIHRDIKPGNILVDRQGTAKILDMGLARFYHSDDDMLTLKYDEKSVLGTADYVAPEQTVNSHDVDVRADIYSLGATFYFLLAGHPPFPDGTIAQKLIAHQTKEPTSIRKIRPEVSEGIEAVLRKMLAKQVEERYQTPEEVSQALLPFVEQQIAPPPESEMPQLSPAAREQSGVGSAPPSGGNKQDSGSTRLERGSGSGRTPFGSQSSRTTRLQAVSTPVMAPPVKPAAGGSSNIRNPFPDPSSQPASSPSKPTTETRRMSHATERTPVAEARPQRSARGEPEAERPTGLFGNPTFRRVAELVIVFGLALACVWAYTKFF